MNMEQWKGLLVEDNPGDAQLIQELLAEAGGSHLHLEWTGRLSSALERLAGGQIDLLLLDLSLPDSQGFETFARVSACAAHLPIIVITGLEDEEMALRILREGAEDYVLKGQLDGRLLLRAIRYAMGRKRAAEALRESEQRYRELFENATYGIYRATLDGNFLDVNSTLVRILGYQAREEVLGLNLFTDVFCDPGHFKRLMEQCEEAAEVHGTEVDWKQESGRGITVRLSGRLVRNRTGELDHCEVIAEDVTERRALQEQLRQAQKMEAIGRLAGGIAHDFNNLLSVIIGYSESLVEGLGQRESLRDKAEEIKKAADSAASLTRQLLAFSRQQVLAPKVLDLGLVVRDTESMLRRLIGEDVDLLTVAEPDLGQVKADPGQMEQVILNLAINARDSMPEGGKLTIETRNAELGENYLARRPLMRPGSYVLLAISDNGMGMDAATQARIFEPFFTTKEQGKGTGLGLATVYGIVKQSGGHIWVYSEPGQGTTFKIYLPRVERSLETAAAGRAPAGPVTGTETILLVEDAVPLRQLACQYLEGIGYTVLSAADGAEAVRIAEKHPGPIDLLLTDVILPGLSGRKVAEHLTAMRKGIKVLYMSGYTNNAIIHHGILDAGVAFLQKPFRLADLAVKIYELLRSEAAE
ncbi:MAG: response regulator [Acidobacteria bacterium]|nr:response regulator [Acidobacteriota bacterium]